MAEGSHSDTKQKRTAHMKRRRDQGLTFKEVGDEFGTSKSTAHRHIKQAEPLASGADMMRGYKKDDCK